MVDAGTRNHGFWSSPHVVRTYSDADGLTPPEEAFLATVPDLASARLLDLGVGAGRTSAALAARVADYRGADYSAPLIEACRRRYAGTDLAGRFDVADARDLAAYADGSFDVVLFGSNSLDYVDHADRQRALGELARVTRPGGQVGVNSHNLAAVGLALSLRHKLRLLRADRSPPQLPLAMARHLPRRAVSIVRNPKRRELLARRWHLLLTDHRLRDPIRTYYVAPAEMRDQLTAVGLTVDGVVGPDGVPVADPLGPTAQTPWLFWCCRRDAGA